RYGGDQAGVRVWRNRSGRPAVLELEPDVSVAGANPPDIYFDVQGQQVFEQSSRALVQGSAEERAAQPERDRVIGGSARGERISCAPHPRGERNNSGYNFPVIIH